MEEISNIEILTLLEEERDKVYNELRLTNISRLYKKEYKDIKAGRVLIFDNGEREMLKDLKRLSADTSHDESYTKTLKEYKSLDNDELINHFQEELEPVINEINLSGKQDEIQALFIEYDFYYHFAGSIECYGKQDYPIVKAPRYITNEVDYNKQILILESSINFKPAWVDCQEFGSLDYIDPNFKMEKLFILHSRTLLHKALENMNTIGKLNLFCNRPFSFYINEHDSEVMTLYQLT